MADGPLTAFPMDPARFQRALDRMDRSDRGRRRRWPRLVLGFEPALESAFLQHRAESVVMLQRLAVLIGVALYGLYFWCDAVTDRRFADPSIWGVQAAFILPGYTVLFVATFLREPWRHTPVIALLAASSHAAGVLAVGAIAAAGGGHGGHGLLILPLLYGFFLLGLVWSRASLLALMVVVVASLLLVIFPQDSGPVLEHVFLVVATAVLGSIGCHAQERSQRRAWLTVQMLRELSERDPLTYLFNHRAFYSRGDRLVRHARREGRYVAALAIDIDHFKRFNDLHGHLAGDACLRDVARIMSMHARRPLDMAARLGGEEFAVFLHDTGRGEALLLAEDLRRAVKRIERPGRISVSIGLAVAAPSDAVTLEGLIGRADVALYRAKNDRRDCVREWTPNGSRPVLRTDRARAP